MAAFNFQTGKSLFDLSKGAENQIVDEQVSAQIRESSTLKATFTKQDIQALLNVPECEGICFYLAPGDNDSHIMVGIGIDANEFKLAQAEAGHFCLSCKHEQTGAIDHFGDEVKNGVNRVLIQNSFAPPQGFFKKNFSADMLNGLLLGREKLQIDVSGISFEDDFITPGQYHTFAISTVDANEELSENVLLNMLPCPPNCGTGYDNALIS
jgi:hypothetical protein